MIKVIKILREGKKNCKHLKSRIGTEWDRGKKHCFVRLCADCGQVEQCEETLEKKQIKKKKFYLSGEAVKILGISKKWLFQLEKEGKLPKARRDKSYCRYYTEADLEKIQKIRERRKKK